MSYTYYKKRHVEFNESKIKNMQAIEWKHRFLFWLCLNGLKLILMTTIVFCWDHVSVTLPFIAFVCWVGNELTSINNLSRPYAWDQPQISRQVNFWTSHGFIWIQWAMRFDSKWVLNSKIDTVHYVLTFWQMMASEQHSDCM